MSDPTVTKFTEKILYLNEREFIEYLTEVLSSISPSWHLIAKLPGSNSGISRGIPSSALESIKLFIDSEEVMIIKCIPEVKDFLEELIPVIKLKYLQLKTQKNLEISKKHISSLSTIIKSLSSNVESSHLLKDILMYAVELVKADHAALFLKDKEKLIPTATYNVAEELTYHIGESLVGWVAKTSTPIFVKDTSKDNRFKPKAGLTIKSDISVPLTVKNKVAGVLSVGKSSTYFSDEDFEIMLNYANAASAVLNFLKLLSEQKQLVWDLELLFKTSTHIFSGNVNSIISRTASLAMEALECKHCSIIVLKNESIIDRQLSVGLTHPVTTVEETRLLKKLIEIKKPIILNSLSDWKKLDLEPSSNYSSLNLIATPMLVENQIIGAIFATDKINPPFSPQDLHLLTTLATYAAAAIIKSKLETETYVDPLTQTHNRRYLEKIALSINSRAKGGERFSIIMVDIDHFKKINDTYGHQMGDNILQLVSYTFKTMLRENDTIIRYGGEEFLLILPKADKASAFHIMERIRQQLFKFSQGRFGLEVTLSAGICEMPSEAEYLEEAIKIADDRLYTAKNTGRNKVIIE